MELKVIAKWPNICMHGIVAIATEVLSYNYTSDINLWLAANLNYIPVYRCTYKKHIS